MRHAMIFAEMLLGTFILVRILRQIRNNSLTSPAAMTKIVAAFALAETLLMLVPAISLLAFTVCWSIPIVCASILPFAIRRRRRGHFLSQRIWILSSLILHVRLGISIRRALLLTSERADFYIGTRLRQLHDRLVTEVKGSRLPSSIDPLLRDLYETLCLCEAEPHLTVQRLVNFRQGLEIHEEFRRKTGQALQQLRAQAYVLTALYLALVTFVIWRFGYAEHERMIMLSILLFTLGVFATLRQGRKIKWSV